MTPLDWIVLGLTVLGIVAYGLWTARRDQGLQGYLKGGDLKWGTIGLSVMATQASAITFLSTPGQGYESGLGFVQNYLGLPIALVIVAAVFLPIYHRLKVTTAYEYLGQRFDRKTRLLGASLFMIQRGLAAGITIYAPAIIMASIFAWPLGPTIAISGGLVILYTVTGGTRTVSLTQKYQMLIILLGMAIAFGYVVGGLPEGVSFGDALHLAGAQDRLQAITVSFDPGERYTLWTGLIGGTFLALAYFGTDQSQVQRYLATRSATASKLGLLFNAVLKIPMQFAILLLGSLLFVFYQFADEPLFFNRAALEQVAPATLAPLEATHQQLHAARLPVLHEALTELEQQGAIQPATREELASLNQQIQEQRTAFRAALLMVNPDADTQDADYVFIGFVLQHLPAGLVGLLVAVILLAAMSSTASELNALAATSVVDFYQTLFRPGASDAHYLGVSRLFTLGWGMLSLFFAMTFTLFDNLIEAVNIIGSLFYGTILGLFLVAFFLRHVGGHAVFVAALLAEVSVLALYASPWGIGYLWFNLIGCGLTVGMACLLQASLSRTATTPPHPSAG